MTQPWYWVGKRFLIFKTSQNTKQFGNYINLKPGTTWNVEQSNFGFKDLKFKVK